ncbi:MAG TPA: SMP-30/gluconolactonase/LRE family protein [Thermoleophilaceae bacterium]
MQVIKTGIVLGESPRWRDGRLWFADWVAREIAAVDPEGNAEVIVEGAGVLPICFDWLPDGRMLIVSGREGMLLRRELDGTVAPYVDLTELAPPPWNDIVVDGRGNAYVGNTGFDFPEGEFAPGMLALVRPDGSARKVAGDVALPNGLAVSADNSTLVLAESYGRRLTAFDIADDGNLGGRRVWADLGDGVPDGICLDAEGAAWYGDVPNRRCVRVREGGEVLETIELDRGCFACMLGGEDGTTLFMVAADWRGSTSMDGEPTGRVIATAASAPHAGWP